MHYIKSLRWIAAVEATSFIALLVATYLKYSDHGATGVQILGPIHGVLFLAYVYLALQVREELSWDNATTAQVLVAAVLPFGGYAADVWLLRDRRPA
jgi:integral membrane protein